MIRSSEIGVARHQIRDLIQLAILRGEFPPGSRLRQMILARRFGVAQSVVRESLLELQMTGLVHVVDNLGVFVGDLSLPRLLEAYDIRQALEGLAARDCCRTAGKKDLEQLTAMAEEIHSLGRAGRTQEMGQLDRALHLRIIEVAGNELLGRLSAAYRILGMTLQASRPIPVIRNEHLAIIKAIGDNDPELAERRARRHVELARRAVADQAASGTFQPQWVLDPTAPQSLSRSPR